MKKVYAFFLFVIATGCFYKSTAQCNPQIVNMAITQPGSPVDLGTKCEYTFSLSFDVITNGGFKYMFFHSWLAADYPSPSIFNCSIQNAQDPGTRVQLGTAVDDPGKSFLDIGFTNLHQVTFIPNTMVDVTSHFATVYENDNAVVLTKPSNSPGMKAYITRKGSSDTLHFDIVNVRVVVNGDCGDPILAKTDMWGSNMNPPAPKAQCYTCALTHSFNDPLIAVLKLCVSSPFKYQVGLSSLYDNPIHVQYKVLVHDPLKGPIPTLDDIVIFTSSTIELSKTMPYSSGLINLPNPYCCVDPWAQYGLYVQVTAQEFSNIFQSPIAEPACATLPVSLKSFTATRNRSSVALKWETSLEENSNGFEIQRKAGNGDWTVIGFVKTKAVNGNSSLPLSYEYSDLNTIKGISQYRLRQVDLDTKSLFSQVRSVRGDGQLGNIIVYPNPSRDGKVNIIFEDADAVRDISLTDMSGRTIRQWKSVTNNNLQIENLNAGFYTVLIINQETGEQAVEKFVVNKR